MKWRWVFLAPLVILGLLAFVAAGGWVVQLLWNWLLPEIFGWRTITFWQAMGLLALCRILFGGFGVHRSGGTGGSRFRRRLAQRCERMTPEERERFRQAMQRRWGVDPAASEHTAP